jgi:hypothetical protein
MLLNLKQLSEALNLPLTTTRDRRWRAKVGLPTVKIGGRVLFDSDDVKRLIDNHKEKMPAEVK